MYTHREALEGCKRQVTVITPGKWDRLAGQGLGLTLTCFPTLLHPLEMLDHTQMAVHLTSVDVFKQQLQHYPEEETAPLLLAPGKNQ